MMSTVNTIVKVSFMIATNLVTNSLAKSPAKQMSHICVTFVSQKFVSYQIGLPQTLWSDFVTEFVSKFVAKMWLWNGTLSKSYFQEPQIVKQSGTINMNEGCNKKSCNYSRHKIQQSVHINTQTPSKRLFLLARSHCQVIR
jgi:hypothetical protein